MSLRDGSFITRARFRVYCSLLLLMSVAVYGYLLATSDGVMDRFQRPLGTDFSNIYAAGSYVREGAPEKPFVPQLQEQREQQLFGAHTPFYGWHYPPFFLPVAGLLAALPYLAALGVWLIGTGLFYLRSMQALWPQQTLWLPLLAYPAVFVNIGHGHNGFLSAALMGCALAALKPKPLLAGICFGLLAYKPQFGLLIPLALLAGGHYRAFASASATVLLMFTATTVLYGMPIWDAFAGSLAFTREVVLEQGQTGFHKIQSLFAAVLLWGGNLSLAYALQGGAIIALAITLWRFWRGGAAMELKCAALVIACFMATPYSMDYDLMLLAPALLLLSKYGMEHGFAPYEKTLLAATFFAPLVARVLAQHTLIPITAVLLMLLYLTILRRGGFHRSQAE